MQFEFSPSSGFDFLTTFSEKYDIPVLGNKLNIPAEMGTGSIRKIDFASDFKLLIHNYTFKEDFILKRKAPRDKNDVVSIIFYSSALPNSIVSTEEFHFTCTKLAHSAIEISSNDLNSEITFPAGSEIYFTVIGIRSSTLSALLNLQHSGRLWQTITSGKKGFIFCEKMWPDIEKIVKHIPVINEQDPLSDFYFRIKIQELLYLLFSKLLKREDQPQKIVSNAEVEKLFILRTAVLEDLSTPPRLADLAQMIGMSETRMKMLFKQVFGDTIYNYYQEARMEEAGFLLKQSGLSVSEVGHNLGFTNLSHFSRLFYKHYDLTPKKYSAVG